MVLKCFPQIINFFISEEEQEPTVLLTQDFHKSMRFLYFVLILINVNQFRQDNMTFVLKSMRNNCPQNTHCSKIYVTHPKHYSKF